MKIFLLASLGLVPVGAMTSSPHPFYESQPNGERVMLKIQGDPYDSYMSDTEGYTVVQNDNGDYVYAQTDTKGDLGPSSERVGRKSNPKTKGMKKGLRPKEHADCKGKICDKKGDGRRKLRGSVSRRTSVITTGNMNNLVVPMRWSDHLQRTLPSRDDLDILMNHVGSHPLCPTGSVRDVFLENSYGALTLNSTVVNWIPMDNTEKYYANGDRGLTTLIHDAITFALQYLDDNHLVDFSDFDDNGDGFIDSITLLHSGNGAEWGGRDAYDSFYTDRIWSHKWALSTGPFTSSSGVKVRAYHISPAVWGRTGSSIGRIGVIAHETGHFLGLPDLYDVNGGGNGIGSYGLMANSWGFDGSQYFPPYLSAWSRLQLGWATATAPLEGINYIEAAANQDATYPRVYKIDEGFPTGEYLLIENRQAYGYDTPLPQGGLAIYHVDENADFKTEGYPGQPLWPENGNHYHVALLQADGNYDLEKGEGRGEGGDVFHGSGVSSLAPSFLPEPGPFPNTDSYQGGLIVSTSVYITEISNSSGVMSFEYHVGLSETASPSIKPVSSPSTLPTTSPSRIPTASPTALPTEAPTSAPSMSTALPSSAPIGEAPSAAPTPSLTSMPTTFPTESPTSDPSTEPTKTAVCLAKGDKCSNDSECCSSSKCKGKRRRRKCA